ncbi:Scr1 family TA system antitoxin-like transcriptional regulator [Streptomyces niveus]|uniref:helix-turn-helix domain-containing protein n=1 Tax=Streptomyces niveus TaxID=193462 RepID=UPI0036A4BF8F
MTADGSGGVSSEPETSDSLKTFGAVLKALREEAGLTQEEFAPRVQYSVHYIAKIEQGKRFPPKTLPDRAGVVLGPVAKRVLTAGARSLTKGAGLASWFRKWAIIEETAISLYAYECRAIPGLLQPESYARALSERRLPPLTEAQIELQVTARMERQRLLSERENTAFCFIIEESVLERRAGGTAVTRTVIEHLLEQGARRNVEIQIMPTLQEDHAGAEGLMYLAETPDNQWLGYSEGQLSSNVIAAPNNVSILLQRYGKLRSQAHSHEATVSLLERLRGAL